MAFLTLKLHIYELCLEKTTDKATSVILLPFGGRTILVICGEKTTPKNEWFAINSGTVLYYREVLPIHFYRHYKT